MRKELEADGRKYVFKVPDVDDMWRVGGAMPILPDEPKKSAENDARSLARNAESIDRLLVECSISPKLTLDTPAEIPAGTYPVREIRFADRVRMMVELQEAGGFTKEAIEKIRPLSATEPDSSTSTGSGSGTESDPVSSSPA